MKKQRTAVVSLLAVFIFVTACGTSDRSVWNVEIVTDGEEIVWDGDSDVALVMDNDTVYSKVHYRGGYSSRYPKHSMAIKTDYAVSLCGMQEERNWVLNASYIDRTFMRHKLAYDIFRMMDSNNRAPRCSYLWLTVDGKPQGLYVAMQRLNANTLGVVRGDCSAVIYKEPPLLYPTLPTPQDSTNPLNQKYPKLRCVDHSGQYEALRQLIFESDDKTFSELAPKVFDLNNIADWHLLILLANNSDGLLKGYYLYKASEQTPWRIAPWDYDHSFGRDGDGERNMLQHNVDCDRSLLLHRLMQMTKYRLLLRQRWQNLRTTGTISVESVNRMIDADSKAIKGYVARNADIWPIDAPDFYDTMDFKQEVKLMRHFFELNIPRLDSIVGKL